MMESVRRVVTGLDGEGRSTVLFDDRVPLGGTSLLWQSAIPADNKGTGDAGAGAFTFAVFKSPGSTFLVSRMEPGDTAAGPLMHATDTLDHLVVLQGRVLLQLEVGSVTIGPGDCIVDRGVIHGWQVIGDEPVVLLNAMVPSAPVGAGATL